MIAIDTNVLLYSIDFDEPVKQPLAQHFLDQLLVSGQRTLLPWQVLVEFLGNLRKKENSGLITPVQVESYFSRFSRLFPIVVPDSAILPIYFALKQKYSLSHWDTLLLAACKHSGVTILYTEDLASNADYFGVLVINPFKPQF